jgi:hypothetical protein
LIERRSFSESSLINKFERKRFVCFLDGTLMITFQKNENRKKKQKQKKKRKQKNKKANIESKMKNEK